MDWRNTTSCCLLCMLLSSPAAASYIQIVPSITAPEIVRAGDTDLQVSVINNGDESAYDVRLSLILPDGFSSKTITYRELKPKETKRDTLKVSISDTLNQGSYVIALLTRYADANNYPFSSVNTITLDLGEPTSSKVYGTITPVTVNSGKSDAMLTVINRDDREHDIKVKMLLPYELKVEPNAIDLRIKPNEDLDMPLKVSSIGALPGSTYPIYARVSYLDGDQQHSSVLRGVVTIKDNGWQSLLPFPLWLPIVAVAAFAAIRIYQKARMKGWGNRPRPGSGNFSGSQRHKKRGKQHNE